MNAPASGVTVRMYRQGHGDCFLLAMRKTNGDPFYMLIDCGLWNGSQLEQGPEIRDVIADIADATNSTLDVVLVTHEHMDHVNGFAKKDPAGEFYFEPFHIDQLWLAWTEDGSDGFANELRERFNDTLLALMGADQQLDNVGVDQKGRKLLRDLLSFETGDDAADALREEFNNIRAARPELSAREQGVLAIEGISNKRAIKYLRDKIDGDPVFLRPDRKPYKLKGVEGARVYALGPPRNVPQLLSLEPIGDEQFHLALDGAARSFLAATTSLGLKDTSRCFDPRFGISREDIEQGADHFLREFIKSAYRPPEDDTSLTKDPKWLKEFYERHYGAKGDEDAPSAWRQIDRDWLAGSEALALRLNNEVNNTSLVIAIELPGTRKVLLFPGDAQRGNWISWSNLQWTVNRRTVTARDLLGRTVFYKVGHHGSHNATLDGALDDGWANISWIATSEFKDEFVAMIPANTAWALEKQGWEHPLGSIEQALHKKARGRVFRSDIDKVTKPDGVSAEEWSRFKKTETDLYFEYTVLDS
jgi:beta-lactamase superfamily II metal-dependent hydrolase